MFMMRPFQIAVLSCLSFCLFGCDDSEKTVPIWEEVKLGDIAPSGPREHSAAQLLKTLNFGIHVFEVPAESIGELDEVWGMLYAEPLRFHSANAFAANSFVVRFGQIQLWDRLHELLRAAGGQKIVTVSLLLPNGQANDIAITGLDRQQTVFYTSADGSTEGANIGPGILALRVKAERIPDARGVCTLIAYPVFTLPTAGAVPELAARAKRRDFPFASAAFGLKMAPGDFVVLGPKRYVPDKASLAGLVFSKPEGSVFLRPADRKAPERRPAVRIFLLVCTRISH
jgi:hypothetical protein